MVTSNDIITKINQLIAANFAGNPVYINLCPKDFSRPSFLIECAKMSRQPVSRTTVSVTVDFMLTCFIAVDNYYHTDTAALLTVQNTVMDLFRKGYINVGDRAIKVKADSEEINFECSRISLKFEYFDDRSDAEDTTLLMGEVTTNTNLL